MLRKTESPDGCQDWPAALEQPPALDIDRHALFLDVDGTLLNFEERPDRVSADAALRGLLRRLGIQMSGAVALVTGRTIADTDRIFGGAVESVAGLHGMERRLRPQVWLREAGAGRAMQTALAALTELAQRGTLNAHIENKGASIALHYRRAPQYEAEVVGSAVALAGMHGLRVLEGKMVVELLAGDVTKGDSICEFMRYPPFAGRTPIAVGDDLTDEDAFLAADRMGGAGVLVGAARATAARHSLADVAAVRAWLLEPCAR